MKFTKKILLSKNVTVARNYTAIWKNNNVVIINSKNRIHKVMTLKDFNQLIKDFNLSYNMQ